jgi:hypothetical protein
MADNQPMPVNVEVDSDNFKIKFVDNGGAGLEGNPLQ